MAGMEDILASLLRGQGPSPMAMGGGAPDDYGDNPDEPQTMMRPEDLIVSPNPSQPRSRDQRMEGIRRLLTDFTFTLGSGMSAASQNPRGRAQRTMAGQGAILQVPEFLQRKQDALRASQEAAQEAQKQNIAKMILQKRRDDAAAQYTLSEGQSRIGANGQVLASAPKSAPAVATPQPYTLSPGQQRRGANNEILAEAPAAEKPIADVKMEPENVNLDGKPEKVLRDASGSYFKVGTKEPITGRITPYIAPPSPKQKGEITPTAEAGLMQNLNKQWETASKDVQDLYRANTIMDSGLVAARAGDLAQGAQAVLVTFQKFLDPTSVVRESEYARSGEGLAMSERIRGYVERLREGGAGVPLSELEKFATLGKQINSRLAAEGNSLLAAEEKRIQTIADRFNIPIETVIPRYNLSEAGGTAGGKNATAAKAGGVAPEGTIVVSADGKTKQIKRGGGWVKLP